MYIFLVYERIIIIIIIIIIIRKDSAKSAEHLIISGKVNSYIYTT